MTAKPLPVLAIATQYTPVPERAKAPPAGPSERGTRKPERGIPRSAFPVPSSEIPDHGSKASPIPILQRPAWKDIHALAESATKVVQADSRRRSGGVNIVVPNFRKVMTHRDWRWRELREGGRLLHYLRCRRHGTADRWRGVARSRRDFQQNNKSDLQLVATVPAYDFHRWRRVDPDFWKDPKNIKAIKRDNPSHVGTVYI